MPLKQGERLRGERLRSNSHTRHPSVMAVSPSGKLLTTVRAEVGKPVSIDRGPEEGVYGIAVSGGARPARRKPLCFADGSKLYSACQPAAYFAPEAGVERLRSAS